jgi:hypothetical protein
LAFLKPSVSISSAKTQWFHRYSLFTGISVAVMGCMVNVLRSGLFTLFILGVAGSSYGAGEVLRTRSTNPQDANVSDDPDLETLRERTRTQNYEKNESLTNLSQNQVGIAQEHHEELKEIQQALYRLPKVYELLRNSKMFSKQQATSEIIPVLLKLRSTEVSILLQRRLGEIPDTFYHDTVHLEWRSKNDISTYENISRYRLVLELLSKVGSPQTAHYLQGLAKGTSELPKAQLNQTAEDILAAPPPPSLFEMGLDTSPLAEAFLNINPSREFYSADLLLNDFFAKPENARHKELLRKLIDLHFQGHLHREGENLEKIINIFSLPHAAYWFEELRYLIEYLARDIRSDESKTALILIEKRILGNDHLSGEQFNELRRGLDLLLHPPIFKRKLKKYFYWNSNILNLEKYYREATYLGEFSWILEKQKTTQEKQWQRASDLPVFLSLLQSGEKLTPADIETLQSMPSSTIDEVALESFLMTHLSQKDISPDAIVAWLSVPNLASPVMIEKLFAIADVPKRAWILEVLAEHYLPSSQAQMPSLQTYGEDFAVRLIEQAIRLHDREALAKLAMYTFTKPFSFTWQKAYRIFLTKAPHIDKELVKLWERLILTDSNIAQSKTLKIFQQANFINNNYEKEQFLEKHFGPVITDVYLLQHRTPINTSFEQCDAMMQNMIIRDQTKNTP